MSPRGRLQLHFNNQVHFGGPMSSPPLTPLNGHHPVSLRFNSAFQLVLRRFRITWRRTTTWSLLLHPTLHRSPSSDSAPSPLPPYFWKHSNFYLCGSGFICACKCRRCPRYDAASIFRSAAAFLNSCTRLTLNKLNFATCAVSELVNLKQCRIQAKFI
jgi:hypothetical protein